MKSFNRPAKTTAKPSSIVQRKSQPTKGLIDNRPTAVIQRKLHHMANAAPKGFGVGFRTGLPEQLKASLEAQSGFSLDDVKVHYNSSKPAEVGALAYAQGSDIYLAPGQEKHLTHEAWHVVQQKQGRVRPTVQLGGGDDVNDNVFLEREADRMGGIVSLHTQETISVRENALASAKKFSFANSSVIQRMSDEEFNLDEFKELVISDDDSIDLEQLDRELAEEEEQEEQEEEQEQGEQEEVEEKGYGFLGENRQIKVKWETPNPSNQDFKLWATDNIDPKRLNCWEYFMAWAVKEGMLDKGSIELDMKPLPNEATRDSHNAFVNLGLLNNKKLLNQSQVTSLKPDDIILVMDPNSGHQKISHIAISKGGDKILHLDKNSPNNDSFAEYMDRTKKMYEENAPTWNDVYCISKESVKNIYKRK